LHYAAEGGYQAVAELLLANGALINAKDEDDLTPLHYAARSDQIKTIAMLVSKGAAVDARINLVPPHSIWPHITVTMS